MEDNKFQFVELKKNAAEHIAAPHYSYWKSVFRRFFSSKVAITMLVIAAVIIVISIIQPMFSGFVAGENPFINEPGRKYLAPSFEHLFGTDAYGNDLFDATWAGTRTSLFIAFTVTAITTVIGVIVGAVWGYSKKIDKFMLELYNIVANVPFTLLVMVLMYVLGAGVGQLIFSLSCTSWLGIAYFIRVQVLIIRDREYNLASRCLGTPTYKVVLHNILPYLISVIVTSIARDVPTYISYEVFLSFLGVGLGAKEQSLGRMIELYSNDMTAVPYLFWIPVAVSAIISVSLYVVGQTMADASDPRTHMM